MSRLRRDINRKKLRELLASANDPAFFRMIWSVVAVQSGRPNKALPFLKFPLEAATEDISSKFAIYPWKLETLVNELLATPKRPVRSKGPTRILDCTKFAAVSRLNHHLSEWESAEDGLTLQRVDVLREMHRLLQRQVEWQRGFLSGRHLYRAHFIYGGDKSKLFFERSTFTHSFSTSLKFL